MAKAIVNIDNFSGGLNNHTNSRDIEANQFQAIDSLSIDVPGKLKVMGAEAEEGTTLTIANSSFNPTNGNGIFYFKSDKDPDQTNNNTVNTEMILVNDKTDKEIKIYEKTTSNAYSAKTISYGNTASDVKITAIDGNIRVTATNPSLDDTTPKVFSFLNEACDYGNVFSGTNFPRVDKIGWFEDTSTIDKPTDSEIVLIHRNDSATNIVPSTEASGATLSADIAATNSTSITVSNGSKFSNFTYIKINNEIMSISNISSNTLTVIRARYGTTAVDSHTSGNAIYYLNRTPISREILRIPYTSGVHSSNTGPLYVNLVLGKESITDGGIPNATTDGADHGTWIPASYDKINLFVQFEYLDGQLSEVEYKSSMIAPELGSSGVNYKLWFTMFGHVPNKVRLKSMHILYNVTNDGFNSLASDITSYGAAMAKVKFRLLDIDVRKGFRIPGANDYQMLNHVDTPSTVAQKKYAWPVSVTSNGSEDYGYYLNSLSYGQGFSDPVDEEVVVELEDKPIFGQTGTSYKTATVLNRRLYIGNVKYKDPITGAFIKTNDTVFKSNTNAFDTFLFDNRIDVEINDGDDIIKLESLSGRLFQFKKNALFVVNVSKDIEYLEASLDYRGVEKDYHVVKGENFIAWFNQYGVFLYDGEQIKDILLDKKGQQVLSNWKSNYYNSNNIIGYIPEEKHIIISKGQSVLVFDLKSMAWSYGSKRLTTNTKTNFITLDNGKLAWMEKDGSALKLRYFNPLPSCLIGTTDIDEIALKTKDFTFGKPSVSKKIISVYLNYKNGDGVILYGFTDGAEEVIARLDGSSETEFKTLRINIRKARTEFENEKIFNNIKNFGLRLQGTNVATNFEINDMQVIFREKSVK